MTHQIVLYGEIWPRFERNRLGISAARFEQQLASIDPGCCVDLLIDSPGGDYNAALAIARRIRDNRARLTSYARYMCFSGAVLLATAASQFFVEPDASLFIHRAIADPPDRKLEAAISSEYAAELKLNRPGLDLRDIWRWQQEEKTFTATEAVEVGLADAIRNW